MYSQQRTKQHSTGSAAPQEGSGYTRGDIWDRSSNG